VKRRFRHLRHRLEWIGLRIGSALIPLLPRWGCYQVGQFFGAVASIIDRRGARVALTNLEVALGNETSPARRKKIVRQSYQSFANTLLDLFWSPRLTRENFRRYIEIENLERAENEGGEKKSGIAASIHYGNFEWLSLAMGFLGYPADIVAEMQKNSLLEPMLLKARVRSGHTVVPRNGAIRRLYKTLRKGGRVAILVDLTVRPKNPSVIINCFGLKTCVTLAHAWLQQNTGAVIVPAHSEPLPGGKYRIVCHPKIELPPHATATEVAQACWDTFEPIIRKNPGPWLWMYKHWRFRPSDATRAYPSYAYFSCHFEKLAKRLKREAETTQPRATAA
jgi:Kdo2-lipid IVA lauroyltransferase/acyltransferase